MAATQSKVVVKNTFLEWKEDEDDVQPRIRHSVTDTAALRPTHTGGEEVFTYDGSLLADPTMCSVAMATAAAAATAAMEAARAAAAAAHPQGLALGGFPSTIEEMRPHLLGATSRHPYQQSQEPAKIAAPLGMKSGGGNAAGGSKEPGWTTVMLRNLPNDYTRAMLLDLLDSSGFVGKYDFVYLPTDFSRRAGLGYAFVNMVTEDGAEEIHRRLEGFRKWTVPSSKVCKVGWSNPCQGLDANVERYRNSPIMHESVPDEFKPMVLDEGVRAAFPPPTKKLRKPDLGKYGRHRA